MAGITRVVLNTKRITAAYTRPANTTAYTSGDALSDSTTAPTALTFTNVGRGSGTAKGGTGVILSAQCVDSVATASQSLELWVFSASPTATNDNSAFAITDAEALNLVAVFPFTTWYASANNQVSMADSFNKAFACVVGDSNLYGLAVVRGAITPSSGEVFTFALDVSQD